MKDQASHDAGYFAESACDIAEFEKLTRQTLTADTVPHAARIVSNVPVYDMPALDGALHDPNQRRALLSEWGDVLLNGAGVVALESAYTDTSAIDEATAIFKTIIADEKSKVGGGGDHFATAGTNDRIWNALQKLCEASPDTYFRYFANPAIAAVCEAWLGPNYQMTTQVNVVYPGGAAQQCHRDYHLGFQTEDICATYPAHVHTLSQTLTLQGAIAHCDMPVESGPTKLLPFSQAYAPGYMAWRREDFRNLFEDRAVQIPLKKGDALFFNPALFHAAGANTSTDIDRLANLLQVSSAFGRAMETVDRTTMCKAIYPIALQAQASMRPMELRAAIAATAEGYAFPTSLDRDPPIGGLAPETQQAFFLRALEEGLDPDAFAHHLDVMDCRRLA